MADNKNIPNMSDTMEINSILEEMHSRENKTKAYQPNSREQASRHARTEVFTPARNADPSPRPAASKARTVAPSARTAAPAADLSDDFVFVGEDGAVDAPARGERQPKKSKKPLIVTLIIVAVILIAGAGGFTWWYLSSG